MYKEVEKNTNIFIKKSSSIYFYRLLLITFIYSVLFDNLRMHCIQIIYGLFNIDFSLPNFSVICHGRDSLFYRPLKLNKPVKLDNPLDTRLDDVAAGWPTADAAV